jgi:hypothetical protein
VLCVLLEGKNHPTDRVGTGYEPPQKFIKSELPGIDFVEIDGRQVWSRDDRADRNSEIPF